MEVRNDAEFRALLRWSYDEHLRSGRKKDVYLVAECHLPHSEQPQEHSLTDVQHRGVRGMRGSERERFYSGRLAATVSQFDSSAVETKLCSVDVSLCPSATEGIERLPSCRLYRNGRPLCECWPALRSTHDALKAAIDEAAGRGMEEKAEEEAGPVPFEALVEDVSLSSANVAFAGASSLPTPVESLERSWQTTWSGMETPQTSARLRELLRQFSRASVGSEREKRMAVLWYKAQWCGASRMLAKPLSLLAQYFSRAPGVLLVEVDVDLCTKFVLSGEGMGGAVQCSPGKRTEVLSRDLSIPCFVCVEYTCAHEGSGEETMLESSRVLTYDVGEVAERLANFARQSSWKPCRKPTVQVEEVDYLYEPPLVEDDHEDSSEAIMFLDSSEVPAVVVQSLAELRRADTRCSDCNEAVASPSRSGDPLIIVDENLHHGSHLRCSYCEGAFSLEQFHGTGTAATAYPAPEDGQDESNISKDGLNGSPPFTVPLLPASWNFRPVLGRGNVLFHSICLERARRAAFLRYTAGSRLDKDQRCTITRLPTFAYDPSLVLSATKTSEHTYVFGYFDDDSSEKKVQELRVRQVTGTARQPGIGSGALASVGDLQIFFRDPGCSLLRCLETQTGGIVRLNDMRIRLDFNRAFLTRTFAPWRQPSNEQEREAQLAQLRKMVKREEEALAPATIGFAVLAGERPLYDPGLRKKDGKISGMGRWMKAALFSAVPAAVGAFLWSQNKSE